MDCKRVLTGSAETEGLIYKFLGAVDSFDSGVPRSLFINDYLWQVMTVGRNGEKDAYPGSQAKDDTGGFFEERGDMVFLTDKAKGCIHA